MLVHFVCNSLYNKRFYHFGNDFLYEHPTALNCMTRTECPIFCDMRASKVEVA